MGNRASVASAATAQANFVLPGQQLSVLPIGLGVFAGVSILALVVRPSFPTAIFEAHGMNRLWDS